MHTRAAFTEEEIVNLTVAIGMINVWNRIAVSFRLVHPVTEDQRRSIA
jgi:alkylhydroperoxidase family enzyme